MPIARTAVAMSVGVSQATNERWEYDRYRNQVMAYCYRTVRCHETAEELTQAIFLKFEMMNKPRQRLH